jgi:hypothetical protein
MKNSWRVNTPIGYTLFLFLKREKNYCDSKKTSSCITLLTGKPMTL